MSPSGELNNDIVTAKASATPMGSSEAGRALQSGAKQSGLKKARFL